MEENSSQVVSITGMGGIGKTTRARQVYNHEIIKSQFSRLAWKNVWKTILQQLRPEYKVTEEELQEKVVGVLKTQKSLVGH